MHRNAALVLVVAAALIALGESIVAPSAAERLHLSMPCNDDSECLSGFCGAVLPGQSHCMDACIANGNCDCDDGPDSTVMEDAVYLPNLGAYAALVCQAGAPHFHDCLQPDFNLGGQPAWIIKPETRGMAPACGE